MTTLTEQMIAGAYAREALRDAENMMALIRQWDMLFSDERAREYAKGTASAFFWVPGFEPKWCANCEQESHFDFRDDPEGACGNCGAWDGQKESAAA